MPTAPLPIVRPDTGPLRLSTGSVWTRAVFRRLWLANLVSQFGDRIHQIALLWWATETTGSPAVAGLLLMVTTLPIVLLSPVTGWFADRWGRRTAMVLADGLRLLLTLVFAGLALSDQLTLPIAVGLSVLMAVGAALFNPAALAIIPEVVDEPDLPQANSWQELTMQGSAIAGPAIGGIAVAALGTASSFACNSLSFTLSALLLLSLRLKPVASEYTESFVAAMRTSLAFLRQRPDVSWLLVSFGVLNFFSVPVFVYMPYFAKEVFGTGATGFGLLEACVPLGMAASALWIGRYGEPKGGIPVFYPLTLLVLGISYLVMGFWPAMGSFMGSLAVAGAAIGLLNVMVISHFQRAVPADQLGRFMGLVMTVAMAVVPVSFGLAGILTHQVAPSHVLAASGLAMLVLAFLVRRLPTAPSPAVG